jgi:hypothetical protein
MRDFRIGPNGRTIATPVVARITGRNLSRVRTVSFGSQQVTVGPSSIKSDTRIEVDVPPFCLTGASATVAILVDDGINAPVSFANGWAYFATGPIDASIPGVGSRVFIVGPCEQMSMVVTTWQSGTVVGFLDRNGCEFNNPGAASCVRINWSFQQSRGAFGIFPDVNVGVLTWTHDCNFCLGTGQFSGFFLANVTNTNAGSGSRLGRCIFTTADCN